MLGKRKYRQICLYLTVLLSASLYSQTNIPPDIDAEGFQPFCPLEQTPIVTSFTIEDPDDSNIESLVIQITGGYVIGQDELILTGTHPNINASWSMTQGTLTLSGVATNTVAYADLIPAVYDVVFYTSNPEASGEREFSFSVGDANYLPSSGHYYQFVSSPGIRWTTAKDVAETYTYFGLQGYLATITTQDEVVITGEQAPGTGWIGGSDRAQEGTWIWETGPEAGTVFWVGNVNGSSPNFAYWNNGEPNDLNGEDYAHVTPPDIGIFGSWNDLPDLNTNSQDPYYPQGFIVEYGGMPGDPDLDLAASTSLYVPEVINTISASRCGAGSVELEAEVSEGDVLWFDAEVGGNLVGSGNIYTTPVLTASEVYYAMASINGCLNGDRIAVYATIDPAPNVYATYNLVNCDQDGTLDGFTDFNLNELEELLQTNNSGGLDYSYYLTQSDAEMGINPISPASPFNNSTAAIIYVRSEFPTGCYSISEVSLTATIGSFPPGVEYLEEQCDEDGENDGIAEFDLSDAEAYFLASLPPAQQYEISFYETEIDAQLEENQIDNSSFVNSIAYEQVLFVRIENAMNGDCIGIDNNLTLRVLSAPEFDLITEEILCLNQGSVIVSVENPDGDYEYDWFNASGDLIGEGESYEFTEGGNYFCLAVNVLGCVSTLRPIEIIASGLAQVSLEEISVNQFSDSNSISLEGIDLGPGDYEFSLDNEFGPFTDDLIFEPVSAGEHLLYIRDKNGCGTVVVNVFVMGFPRYFSPNNDGYNDTWNIKGWPGLFTSASTIKIFDRFGKLLKQFSPASAGWDGSLNGLRLPQSDYWYVAELRRNSGEVIEYRGHFSLRR